MARVGVLGLQGDVREHLRALCEVGADATVLRHPDELGSVDAVILPGGESTTIGRLAVRFGLLEPLRKAIEEGLPAYGTCAGMILLAQEIVGSDQPRLGVLDIAVRRNAFGRQNESFEADLAIAGLEEGPFHAVFIRAPWVERVGPGVEVLATVDGHPVMVRQGHVLASSFHPELTNDHRVHKMWVDMIEER